MTRATLLHFLDQPTAIAPEGVRELEQLAQAFPYCQTAHLLLAKAAHDHGTMLAGQRLRRAATYAADRALLRRLIEQVAPEIEEEVVLEKEAIEAPAEPIVSAAPAPQPAPVVIEIPAPVVAAEPAAPLLVAEYVAVAAVAVAPVVAPVVPPPVLVAEVPTPPPVVEVVAPPLPVVESPVITIEPIVIEDVEQFLPAEVAPAPSIPEPVTVSELALSEVAQPEKLPLLVVETAPVLEEEELPAQAPAIRPPAEVGEARFEFGLNETPAPKIAPVYELPLVDEWAAAATTLALAPPDLDLASNLPTASSEEAMALTPAAFTGDTTVGYSFGESSRLGFSIQLLDQLFPADDADVVVEFPIPAAPLPPTATFFEPDALLLEHWAEHRPPMPVLPSSLDLINNFLRRQPRLTRPAMLPPSANTQADLSARSTRTEPNLVSESLAQIYARQGKTERAVEIYELLMVKQPEKMAYFAAQIQQLQPPV